LYVADRILPLLPAKDGFQRELPWWIGLLGKMLEYDEQPIVEIC